MSEPVERYALARRGLPLPTAKQSTLKGAWLPAAVRNGDSPRRAQPIVVATAPVVEEPIGEEPWWMEASELVPVAESRLSPAVQPLEIATPVVVVRDREVGKAEHADVGRWPMSEPALVQREGTLTREVVVSAPNEEPTHETSSLPVSPRVAAAPAIMPPMVAASIATDLPRETDRERIVRHEVRVTNGKPEIKVLSFGVADAPATEAPASRDGPEARTEIIVREARHDSRASSGSAVETSRDETHETTPPTVIEVMGVPVSAAVTHNPAPSADLTPLLTPARPSRGEVRIDRVAVTVKASGTAGPSAPAPVLASAPPIAAPAPARSYRNPWASYFTRLD